MHACALSTNTHTHTKTKKKNKKGSRDTTLRVWDPATAECRQVLTGHGYQVTAVKVLPSGDLVSASLDK